MPEAFEITTIGKRPASGLMAAGAIMGALLMLASYSAPASAAGGAKVPSTFGDKIGSGLLCLDQIDPFYFWSYLNEFFGPPYKKEGGAYWFKVQTSLWGAAITDVMVSDGADRLIFLAATSDVNPDELSVSIMGRTGISYQKTEPFQYSPMMSGLGSKIVFSGQKSKIFCAKDNLSNIR